MNVKKLHYFCEICKDMNLTYTSRRLYVTQQSLSYVIRTLEQELKCTLFSRTASGLELTEQGMYFFRRCSHILEELYDTYEVIHKISSDTCESLRISLLLQYASPRTSRVLRLRIRCLHLLHHLLLSGKSTTPSGRRHHIALSAHKVCTSVHTSGQYPHFCGSPAKSSTGTPSYRAHC